MNSTAEHIAQLLLDIKAVTLNVQQPYRYTSGILSPIYCDNRLLISDPEKRLIVLQAFLDVIRAQRLQCDVVAGVATAGIPHAAWIADRLQKPMVYVRKKAKEHGMNNVIEGECQAGQTALLIEDLISTGGSSVQAGLSLREHGATVTDCIAIFSYQIEKAMTRFAATQITLHTLSNFTALVDVAARDGYITNDQKKIVLEWQQDPAGWEAKHFTSHE